ncbi:MAG: AtpZ/AtpI family protein [Micropruina sp.]|uniref:AtpZ/AtpI family protein n=1 Tax=Micropruina sp. TaxID=2737536 RepID=UPI0039E319BB
MEERRGLDEGLRCVSYLLSGVLLYGGVGWLIDHWLGTSFALPVGIVLGAAGGVYLIHKRYGRTA